MTTTASPGLKVSSSGRRPSPQARSTDGRPGRNYLCAGCGAFYSHITADMLAMVRLLGEGRPPADIMDPGTRRALRPEEE